ncbi:MAG: ribosome recycling factor [Candidatus Hydrogenedentes bacterium]|jgi:ribosome recycling factor|nr:ribosome recycling factor [Candidatus Hydrogenedentota bacterium]
MVSAIVKDARDRMDKTVEAFTQELVHIRTGRASVGLLDTIDVEVYGASMKMNQVASITAPEPRLLVVQPWDKTQIAAIEKAILKSPLDITPSNDGQVIRLPLPQLTEDRRKDLVKMVGKLAEECRVSIRGARRHEVDEAKKKQKSGELPEDDAHKLTSEIQKITDEYVKKIDDMLKAKEVEIMEV